MHVRIRRRGGWWKTFLVYHYRTEYEYEVYLDRYPTLKEARSAADFVVGVFA